MHGQQNTHIHGWLDFGGLEGCSSMLPRFHIILQLIHYEFCGHWTFQCSLFPKDHHLLWRTSHLSFCVIYLEALHSSLLRWCCWRWPVSDCKWTHHKLQEQMRVGRTVRTVKERNIGIRFNVVIHSLHRRWSIWFLWSMSIEILIG